MEVGSRDQTMRNGTSAALAGPSPASAQRSHVRKVSGRARRFALHLPVRYRCLGEARWQDGRMENISRSGVLFWTDHPAAVDSAVEIRFVLPVGPVAPGVLCRGRIVRTVPAGPERLPGVAATISAYRFLRPPDAA